MTTTPLTEQQLDEITAIAARATEHPFHVSDCEGSLQVWREKALVRVRRDEHGQIEGYSFPATYKVTDQVIELDLGTWDPGEDATDDQQRQDIRDLVEARAALGALLAKIERLEGQRKVLLDQLARKDAASGEGDKALREFLGGEPGPSARAHRDAEIMRRCAEFVRDSYDGEWAADAASTLERDADITEHGCPGYEDAGRGDTVAERQLANCKHCGRPRAACVAAAAPTSAPPAASHSPAGDRDGETGTEGAAGRVGDSGPVVFETEINVRGWTA